MGASSSRQTEQTFSSERQFAKQEEKSHNEVIKQLDKAFTHRTRFYETFLKQDMQEMDRELFPIEEVFASEINPMGAQRVYS